MKVQARNEFFIRNRQSQVRRHLQSNGLQLPFYPLEFHGALLSACEGEFAKMSYGSYMDRADGLGYDDVAGFDYGYDEAVKGLAAWFDSILKIGLNAAKWVGTAAENAYKWSGTAVKNAYNWTKTAGVNTWGFVTKTLPKVATKAYNWAATAKITYPVRLAIAAGRQVGTWVWDGIKWLFKDRSGNQTTAPAGTNAPGSAPNSINIQPNTSGGGGSLINYPNSDSGGTTNPGNIININQGNTQPYGSDGQPVYQQQPPYQGGQPVYSDGGGGYGTGLPGIQTADGQAVQTAQEAAPSVVTPILMVGGGLVIAYLIFS